MKANAKVLHRFEVVALNVYVDSITRISISFCAGLFEAVTLNVMLRLCG